MTYRLGDLDCLSARTQAIRGNTVIQCVWVYDRPVDRAGLANFHAALQRGFLARVVAGAKLGAAGDRWTARARFAPLEVGSDVVKRSELRAWLAEQSRAEVNVYGGPAWRLFSTDLDDGGAAVLLLVSHSIADALMTYFSVLTAIGGGTVDLAYKSDEYGRFRLLLADSGQALRRLGKLAAAVPGIVRAARDRGAVVARGAGTATAMARLSDAPSGPISIPVVVAVVPAARWRAVAVARSGSSNALAVAVAAGIATAIGRTDDAGRASISIPVSTRGENDQRANALREVHLDVDAGPFEDLAPLRSRIKDKLRDGSMQRAFDAALSAAVAMPRPKLPVLVRKTLTGDFISTGCSSAGKLDDAALTIDGQPATSFLVRNVQQGLNSHDALRAKGGVLQIVATEIADVVCLSVSGLHPPNPLTEPELSAVVAEVLGGYGLTATYW